MAQFDANALRADLEKVVRKHMAVGTFKSSRVEIRTESDFAPDETSLRPSTHITAHFTIMEAK